MQTHEQLVAKLMRRPGVRKEVERIECEEGELLDILGCFASKSRRIRLIIPKSRDF